jgi:hypothetical protein
MALQLPRDPVSDRATIEYHTAVDLLAPAVIPAAAVADATLDQGVV